MLRATTRGVVLAPIPAAALAQLREKLMLAESPHDPLSCLLADPHRVDYEIAFTIGNRPLSRAMIDLLPGLRYVCHYGVGTDQIDIDALRERGILLTNTAGASASCVADLAVTLLLSAVRRVPQADAFVRNGDWRNGPFSYSPAIGGRRIGIYGMGDIGVRIATRLAAFETEIGYFTRTPRPSLPHTCFPSLFELARWSDDLIVAVSATPQTLASIDRKILDALGSNGVLVNVARGSIVNEEDLIAALASGSIAGAGLDTFADEPTVDPAFRTMENVVLSPHVGGGTQRAIAKATGIFLENLDRYLAGRPPQNVVS